MVRRAMAVVSSELAVCHFRMGDDQKSLKLVLSAYRLIEEQ